MREDSDIVERLVDALAARDGLEPHELDYSLHDYIDTDALMALSTSDHEHWSLAFEVSGHDVTINGSGTIRIDGEPVEGPESPTLDGTERLN